VLELLGENWHQPALVDSLPNRDTPNRRKDDGDASSATPAAPVVDQSAPPEPPRPAAGPAIGNRSSAHREFEW
jgi:hypothetical protein